MFESKSGIFVIAGLGFFLLAFLSNGLVPWLMYANRPEKTAEEMVNRRVMVYFRDLAARYPEAFERDFGEPTEAKSYRTKPLASCRMKITQAAS